MSIFNMVYGKNQQYKTFTITREEKSDMSSWWTYSDDASGLSAGSTAFDEFFSYSAVRLSDAWIKTAEVFQSTPWQLDFSQLWTLTSWDNVMIKFPILWIKMSKSWSTVTLSITDNPRAGNKWFKYYAHTKTWTLIDPWTPVNNIYIWAFKASNNGSNVLKSWSWKTPEVSQTQGTFCSRAKANGSGYNIIWFYQRQFVNALYMMKYGNPNSQNVVWAWYTRWSSVPNTWWTTSQILATYWTSSETQQMKLFWLEDWWWSVHEWIWWGMTDNDRQLLTSFSWWSGTITTSDYPLATWTTLPQSVWNISAIAWNNYSMFAPTSRSWYNYSIYYCDYMDLYANRLITCGGNKWDNVWAWAFRFTMNTDNTSSGNDIGSRLMFF